MKRIDDMIRWTEAALDTPFAPPEGFAWSPSYYPPGICVKTRERDAKGRPAFCGRVVTFDTEKNYVLIRSYGSRFDVVAHPEEAGTIWEGFVSDALKMWEVD